MLPNASGREPRPVGGSTDGGSKRMLKPTLIALAALTAFDAIAFRGHHCAEFIGAVTHVVHGFLAMGWSMTMT